MSRSQATSQWRAQKRDFSTKPPERFLSSSLLVGWAIRILGGKALIIPFCLLVSRIVLREIVVERKNSRVSLPTVVLTIASSLVPKNLALFPDDRHCFLVSRIVLFERHCSGEKKNKKCSSPQQSLPSHLCRPLRTRLSSPLSSILLPLYMQPADSDNYRFARRPGPVL